jgi:hypothetical protein
MGVILNQRKTVLKQCYFSNLDSETQNFVGWCAAPLMQSSSDKDLDNCEIKNIGYIF